jgi:hypothetical protein
LNPDLCAIGLLDVEAGVYRSRNFFEIVTVSYVITILAEDSAKL